MWIAIFSHSGSELASIVEVLGKKPDYIITNNHDISKIDYRIEELNPTFMKANEIHDYLEEINDQNPLVTLHGYNRIIPLDSLCDKMYNVHPGDTIKYPELRGKDPQKKALELGLNSTGVIIHQVDEGVDTGETQMVGTHPIREGITEKELIDELRVVAISLWCAFLVGKV